MYCSDNWHQWEWRGGLGGEERGGDEGRPRPVSSRVPVWAQGTTLSWWLLQNQSPRCRMSNFTVELDCVQNRYLGLAFAPSHLPPPTPHPAAHNEDIPSVHPCTRTTFTLSIFLLHWTWHRGIFLEVARLSCCTLFLSSPPRCRTCPQTTSSSVRDDGLSHST